MVFLFNQYRKSRERRMLMRLFFDIYPPFFRSSCFVCIIWDWRRNKNSNLAGTVKASRLLWQYLIKLETCRACDAAVPFLGTEPRLVSLNTGCTTETRSKTQISAFLFKLPRWLFNNLCPGEKAPTGVNMDTHTGFFSAILCIVMKNWK